MSTALAHRLMTADDFWQFCHRPENADRSFDLIRGEVFEMSRGSRVHGTVTVNIIFVLKLWLRSHKIGHLASNDSGVVLRESPATVVGPDVAYFTDANRFQELLPKWSDVPPVLAVEVLSPNDRPMQVNRKIAEYLNGGVRVVWLVDYEERRVIVYRPNVPPEVLNETDTLTGGADLPGFSCAIGEFFRLDGDTAGAS